MAVEKTEIDTTASYIVFAVAGMCYLLMHIIAAKTSSTLWWGVDSWRYLPDALIITFGLTGLFSLFPVIQNFFKPLIIRLGRIVGSIPIIIWLIAAAIILYLFRQRTFFLGDGLLRIRSVEVNYLIFSFEEPLDTLLHTGIHSIVRYFFGNHGSTVIQGASITAGILAVFAVKYYLVKIYNNKSYRWFLGLIIASAGSVQLFFGYAESYTIVNLLLLIFLFSSLSMIKCEKESVVPAVFLSIAVITHPVSILFIPGALYAYWIKIHGNNTGISLIKRWLKPSGIFISCIGIIMIIFRVGGNSPLLFLKSYLHESNMLPLFSTESLYGIFSVYHIVDMLNETALILPTWILLIIAVPRIKFLRQNQTLLFLLLCSLGPLFFMSVFNPKLGYARDWDIFSLTAFPVTLLLGSIILESNPKRLFKIGFPLVVLSLLHTVPWILVNASVSSSTDRFTQLADTPHWPKDAKGIAHEALASYYRETGNIDKYFIHYHRAYDLTGNTRYFINIANMYLNIGDTEKLKVFIQKDSLNAAGHYYLGSAYLENNDIDRARSELEIALSLNTDYPGLHVQLGQVYLKSGRYDDSILEFKQSLEDDTLYKDGNVHAVHNNLAYLYAMKGMHDEAVIEYKKAIEIKPDFTDAHLNLAKTYYKLGKKDLAEKHARLALQYGSSKDDVDQVLRLLSVR